MTLDLPLIWAVLIAVSVLLYVVLDGFDLGVGILLPLAERREDRDLMLSSIAPFWDGNEVWLLLAGGGLLAAFPGAFAILAPAFWIPGLAMSAALVLRGVAFDRRVKGDEKRRAFWTVMFSAGSILAALAQGAVLGGFIGGVKVAGDRFAGGPFDWLTPYTALVALGLTAGYALLGACWLVWKTDTRLYADGRRWARWLAMLVGAFLAAVSAATLVVHPLVAARWGWDGTLHLDRFARLASIPLIGMAGLATIGIGLWRKSHRWPFGGGLLVFLSGYLGLAAGFSPHAVPYALDYRQAAAPDSALAVMLVGAAIAIPLVLGYTAWVYWVFRGKVTAEGGEQG
jgi:cytochrome d ubiquinol oxidase subunit II